jgi:hypothetical protein
MIGTSIKKVRDISSLKYKIRNIFANLRTQIDDEILTPLRITSIL